VWNLNLSVAGQTLVVPLYVNPTSGASAALGSYNLKICLPPWDVPQGTPGRAFQGAQVLDAKFSVDKIFTTPASAGVARWEALFTPYTPGKGTPNPAGTFEARALVPLPAGVSLSARVVSHKKGTYRLTGKVSEGGAGSAGTAVTIARGTKPTALKQFGAVTTSSAGTFTLSGKAKRKKNTYFQASASAKERDVTSTGCASPLTAVAPAGCVSATLSPWSAKSAVVRVRP
jgi:hypothetical protein